MASEDIEARNPGGVAPRVVAVDVARGLAIAGMVVFHFVRDLEFFGIIARGTTLAGPWAIFARLVAGSFLFLAGVSLALAHGNGIRWRSFLRRTGVIALAALGVSVATYVAMPAAFVYFGILHAIVLARIVGLAFLRLPVTVVLGAAAFAWLLPAYLRSPVFDARWGAWIGLAEKAPRSLDFEPLLPWLAPCLIGIAMARLALQSGLPLLQRSADWSLSKLARLVTWAGRNSLAIYLLHQPILLGILWVFFG